MCQLYQPGFGMETSVCNFLAQEALQLAKRVAETEYSVVGTVEEFNITLAVMEAYLPGGYYDDIIELQIGCKLYLLIRVVLRGTRVGGRRGEEK